MEMRALKKTRLSTSDTKRTSERKSKRSDSLSGDSTVISFSIPPFLAVPYITCIRALKVSEKSASRVGARTRIFISAVWEISSKLIRNLARHDHRHQKMGSSPSGCYGGTVPGERIHRSYDFPL